MLSYCLGLYLNVVLKDLRLKLRHLSNLTSSQAVPPKLLFRFYEQIVIIVRIPEPNKSHPSPSE